jgi:hypothetical protein
MRLPQRASVPCTLTPSSPLSYGRLRRASLAVGAWLVMAACGAPPAPAPVPMPAPRPVTPPPVTVSVLRVSIPSSVPAQRYDVRVRARLQRDSAGRKDEQRVESRGLVTMSLQRAADGALRSSGRVDSFAVQVDGAGVSPVSASPTSSPTFAAVSTPLGPVLFDASLDGLRLLVATRPPLANECDRPEAGATALVRDLVVRIPASLSEGDRWRDSTVSIVCRVGIPITVRTQSEYEVRRIEQRSESGPEPRGSTGTVIVRRQSSTRMEGKLTSAWRALELVGTGLGSDEMRVDVASGALLQLEGEGTLTLQLTDRSRGTPRVQRVVQALTVRATNLR